MRSHDGDSTEPLRLRMTRGGPLLVPGPVKVELADGTAVESTRFQVALCTCGRSEIFPFCDTSHRRRRRRS